MRIRTWNRVTRYLAKRYETCNFWVNVWDERFEWDNDVSGNYKPNTFLWLMFKAWMTKNICWDCKGHGQTGYYEPEACSTCQGFGYNWQNFHEPDWGLMADGMREAELADSRRE